MTRNFGVLAPAFMVLAVVGYACTQGEVIEGPATSGAAGSTNPGTAGTGNPVGVSGTTGAGNTVGQAGRGGTTGAGNTVGQAGRGGTTGAGNTVGGAGRGGTTGAGNTVGSAGTTGTGNTAGVAGTTGSAGSTGACAPSFAVSADGYVQMPVSGGACWTGYPYTYADTFGSMVMPTTFSACGTPCMLKMTGNIVAVSGTMYSYAGMGFNLGQTPAGGTTNTPVTPKGSGLTFNFSNGTTGTGVVLRAQVENGTTTWCTNITTSPAVIPYSSFKIDCFAGTPGASYNKEPITKIALSLAGGTAAGAINVTLMSVTEN